MVLESNGTAASKGPGATYSFTMSFRLFDRNGFFMALEDLKNAGVWADDEGPLDNTIEQNLEILIEHLDVLATYRGLDNIAYMDIGIERAPQ